VIPQPIPVHPHPRSHDSRSYPLSPLTPDSSISSSSPEVIKPFQRTRRTKHCGNLTLSPLKLPHRDQQGSWPPPSYGQRAEVFVNVNARRRPAMTSVSQLTQRISYPSSILSAAVPSSLPSLLNGHHNPNIANTSRRLQLPTTLPTSPSCY